MLYDQIKNQIKDAMRAKDAIRLEVLRGLSAIFTNEIIKKSAAGLAGSDKLTDEEVIVIIRRCVKQRKDSIEQFEKGGRKDLADKEQAELATLQAFLPSMMSQEEIAKFVTAKLAETNTVVDKTKIGQLTGQFMKELKGKADGADVKAVVEKMVS